MTGNELYEEYCNEYPLMMGYREVSYESWLQRQVIELRENVVTKNCNIPRVSNSLDLRELERKLDEALGKETRETLTEWLKQQRQ